MKVLKKFVLASSAKQNFSTQCLNKNTRKFVKLTSRRCALSLPFLSSHASSLGNTITLSSFQVLMSLSLHFPRTLVHLNVVCNIPSQGCGWVGLKNFRQQFLFLALPPQTLGQGGQKPKHLDTICQSSTDWSSSSQVSTIHWRKTPI